MHLLGHKPRRRFVVTLAAGDGHHLEAARGEIHG
jgi:hypothetical protein